MALLKILTYAAGPLLSGDRPALVNVELAEIIKKFNNRSSQKVKIFNYCAPGNDKAAAHVRVVAR